MVPRLVSPLVCVLLAVSGDARGQTTSAPPDGVALLLNRIEKLLVTGDPAGFTPLFSAAAAPEPLRQFADELVAADVTRAVVRERDRLPLDGTLPGDGYSLVVDFFTESATRGRIVTARLDVRRPRGAAGADDWRLAAAERLTSVEGLHRLSVNAVTQFAARNLRIKAEDMELVLHDGDVFAVDSADGVTGLVLFGRGEMLFSPGPEAERSQVRIFAGAETLTARFDTAFVRMNPGEYESRVATSSLRSVAVEPRLLRRAEGVFAEEAPKSFSLDLSDLSRDTWYLIPGYGDFLAEVRTRRHGTLTYARSTGEAEDVTLFDREKHRNIALYPSPQKLASRGRFYDEDDLTDFDVLDHQIDVTVSPERQFIEGRARMRVRIRAYALATLTIRLADPLTVTGVASAEHGRLLHLRVKNQNSIVVNLPTSMARGSEMTLLIVYSGRLAPQGVDREALQGTSQRDDAVFIPAEPHYLLSNRAYWHPQGQVTDYATATMRITVPDGYGCVASGELAAGSPVTMKDATIPQGAKKQYVFTAADPLRYLSLVVSRFVRVTETTVPLVEGAGGDRSAPTLNGDGTRAAGFRVRDRIALTVEANPRQVGRGREMTVWASDILRFYSGIVGEAPYHAMSLALVEHDLPGGHSPGYFAVLNNPLPSTPFLWRNDPAAFTGFPEFFLAHELAHQWWGQAVGWKNYHEQWISEGFAQYFAALYAQKAHGDETFVDMLRQFRRWALAESDQGPVHLGYRLGHIRGEPKVFRALLYNKGAAVLHMLRRLVGDEAFFASLRRFYHEQKFEKAGTDDLQRAFEAETGRPLERFFERWIYAAALPRLRYTVGVGERDVSVRFVQMGELLFDVPVTVTIVYADGRSADVVVAVTEKEMVEKIPTEGAVRAVHVNRDAAAIAHFDES
jgi:hypothetical protein